MNFSLIIPAFNEADYLPATLESIQRASEHLQAQADVDVEVYRRRQQQHGRHRCNRRGYGRESGA